MGGGRRAARMEECGGGEGGGEGGEQEKQGDPKESKIGIGCTCEQCDPSGRRCPSTRPVYIPPLPYCLELSASSTWKKRNEHWPPPPPPPPPRKKEREGRERWDERRREIGE